MLSRYKIYRGKRPPDDPLPDGIRLDTRYRTHHPLRPPEQLVKNYLAAPTDSAWHDYEITYLAELEHRFAHDPLPFDRLADMASRSNIYLGCNCPTQKNPNPAHCHTHLALQFMKQKYPRLNVVFPQRIDGLTS